MAYCRHCDVYILGPDAHLCEAGVTTVEEVSGTIVAEFDDREAYESYRGATDITDLSGGQT